MSSSSGGYFHQSYHETMRQSEPASTPTNLLSSSSSMLKECVLPPAMWRCRRMFAMMHLRNFCQVSIEEVRQMMTRSPVKVLLSTETVKGVDWKWRQLELRTPVKTFWLRHCHRPLYACMLHGCRGVQRRRAGNVTRLSWMFILTVSDAVVWKWPGSVCSVSLLALPLSFVPV